MKKLLAPAGSLAIFTFFCFVMILIAAGCTDSKKTTSSILPWTDDGVEPNNPTWRSDSPYIVQKVGENFYQVTLDWNPVTTNKYDQPKKNIVGYYVYRKHEGGADKRIATTTDDSYVDKSPELVEGERYYYTIYAFDNLLRQSAPSAPQLVRLEPTTGNVPKPPTNIYFAPTQQSTLSFGKGGIIVSWDPPTQNTDGSPVDDLKEYEVERHASDTSEFKQVAKIPAGKSIFIDSNLTIGTYYYRVRAVDTQGNKSQWVDGSFTLTGKTDDIAPGTPYNLQATGDAAVVLTWTRPETDSNGRTLDLAGFKIYRKELDSAQPYELVKVIAPSSSWTDTQVNPDKYYQYAITSYDLSGNESRKSQPATNKVGVTFPDTPAGLIATLFSGQVVLSWNPVTGASYYRVYRSNYYDGIYSQIGQPAGTTYTTATSNAVTYYYKVSAVDSFGREGSPTNFVMATAGTGFRTFEAEAFVPYIWQNNNASNTQFSIEVDSMQYPWHMNTFLFFSPINVAAGEMVDGIPAVNQDADAVNDWFEIREFLPQGMYQAKIYAIYAGDAGIYEIRATENAFLGAPPQITQADFYSNRLDVLYVPLSIRVDSTNGSDVIFRFTCKGKNPSSADYRLYLDKIVVE